MSNLTKRTQIYLTESQSHFLSKTAQFLGISMAELIRKSVDEYRNKLESINYEDDPIWKIVGRASSKVRDGARDHDRYIYGEGK